MTILGELEEKLGGNLVLLRDKLDLLQRQGDADTIKALRDLDEAWEVLALLAATEKKAKRLNLTFNAVHDGHSVVDALFRYASEMFPNAVVVTKRQAEGRD